MLAAEQQKGRILSDSGPRRVLLVDDNEALRSGLCRYLQIHGFEVVPAADGRAALDELQGEGGFPIVLTDLRLPDRDGVEIALRARELDPDAWIGLITGWDVDPDDDAYRSFDAVLQKPVDAAKLVASLKALRGLRENRALGR